MNRLILAAIVTFAIGSVKAQSYMGLLTDNYSGVHGVISNPANIVDSRFKTDINLIGASAFFGNDYFGVKLSDVFKDNYDFETDAKRFSKDKNSILGNIDILGPSFMFNINKNNSIAIFSRARVLFNATDINGSTLDQIIDEDEPNVNDDYNIDEGDIFSSANAWAEIGISYATILMNKEEHFIKGGISLKYLQGLGNAFTKGKNILVDYDADGTSLPGGQTTGSIKSEGEVTYGYSANVEDDFEDFEIVKGATGFGADLGFVYEWRPNYTDYNATDSDGNTYSQKDKNKYKLKLGLSITDIGGIKYKESTEKVYDIGFTVNEDDFDQYDDLDDILNNLYTEISSSNASKAILPTALHLNADWNLNSKFYLNLNTDLSLTSKNKINTGRIANRLSLTPRFESKWFSFHSPISLVQYSGFQWGAGLRAGPLYIGSGSILSVLMGDSSKSADVYAGLKIPIYQGRPKDKDEDGVLDKVDGCPETPGSVENFGCPWKDTDEDTVLDKDDECPEEAGPVENKGCPWKDTDGDTILDKDDNCPEEKGDLENNGCPWKDGDNDGVLDKDDECPNEAGTVANKGCPEEAEVTAIVQKSLNEYAKTILFNTGKASIKSESTSALVDIIKILNEYPSAKFTVEGHTDSIGSIKTNQKLSEARAKAVKDFLIKNEIDASRLSSIGYGESKPIATNMYKDGREKNRRVEINLVK
ncbi:MAG: DUF5723 family protein [Cellulophaga sp.]